MPIPHLSSRRMRILPATILILLALQISPPPLLPALSTEGLSNPILSFNEDLRDPAVIVTPQGYRIFFSRLTGEWGESKNWTIGTVLTKDFKTFTDNHDVSPPGSASPGDVILWHGRWILPYISYPRPPNLLRYATSRDLATWSPPLTFLKEAASLPWNGYHRVIDPTLVIDGGTLHCFFIGSATVQRSDGTKGKANLLGHAITTDPDLQKWTILTKEKPILGSSPAGPDGVENLMVFPTGDHWTMIYSEGLNNQHIARAESKDLITWETKGRIELPTQQWMKVRHGAPYVWREGATWWMILMGESTAQGISGRGKTTFGLLSSKDTIHWTPLTEAPPPPINSQGR